jgi:hypothetical protein
MRNCLLCDESIEDYCYRILVGGITYDDLHGAQFIQLPADSFTDGTKAKWLCLRCATNAELYIKDLDTESCQAPEGFVKCDRGFEDMSNPLQDESVLCIEWGHLVPSDKQAGEAFISEIRAHVHFNCACDAWRLPLHCLEPQDFP